MPLFADQSKSLDLKSSSETIIARHCGIRVLAMSLVTNNAVMYPGPRGDEVNGKSHHELQDVMKEGMANHEEVLETSRNAAEEIMVRGQNLIVQVATNKYIASDCPDCRIG